MKTIEVASNVHWVGVVDWDLRDFHGYSTPKGTTYNSFLVTDSKTALFDTVKAPLVASHLDQIARVIDPNQIDYIVVNHVEMDHSGGLPAVIDAVKPEKIICSANGKKALLAHFHREDWPYEVVKTGDTISLGEKSVKFIETRMLHWPDSMFSYIENDRLLISSDAFGQHWGTSERFDDEVDSSELMYEAGKYYANILLPYSPLVQKLLASVAELGIQIDTIAPDHGLIWRSNPTSILEAYDSWSRQEAKRKALVVYDTMWQSTKHMALAVADGLVEQGVAVKVMNMVHNHRSEVVTELLDATGLVVGSSTLNNGILPRMADLLTYVKGLRPANKVAAAFGSYGWGGEAVKILNGILQEMKCDVPHPGVRVQYVPTAEDLAQCRELGYTIGNEINQRVT